MKQVHSFHDIPLFGQSTGAAWLQEDGAPILDENGKKILLEKENGKTSLATSEMQDGSEVQAVESFMVAHNTGGNFEAKRITLEQLFQITDELDQELPIHSDSLQIGRAHV